jgi:hypothetical protein
MDEADVVAGRALADPAGREAHALRLEPRHGRGEVVDPEPDVVQRGVVDLRLAVRIDRLHQVDLDPVRARARHRDVLVDVLALAAELALEREAEQLDPEPAQRELVGPPTAICCNPSTRNGRAAITRVLPAGRESPFRSNSARWSPCGSRPVAATALPANRARSRCSAACASGPSINFSTSAPPGCSSSGSAGLDRGEQRLLVRAVGRADAGELGGGVREQDVGRARRPLREPLRERRVARDRRTNAIAFANSSGGSIALRSTPTTRPVGPTSRAATCIQPPGQQPRSITR